MILGPHDPEDHARGLKKSPDINQARDEDLLYRVACKTLSAALLKTHGLVSHCRALLHADLNAVEAWGPWEA